MQVHLRHLHSAWYQVQRGSQAAGIDGITPEGTVKYFVSKVEK